MATASIGGSYLTGAVVDSSNNIYLRNGAIVTKLDALGNIIWSYSYSNIASSYGTQPSIILDPTGDIIMAYSNLSPNYAGGIAKISRTDGSVLWTRNTSSAIGTGWFNVCAASVDPSGNVYFICDDGSTTNSSYMIVKFNNAGTWQWQRKIDIGTVISTSLLMDLPKVVIANANYVYFGGMAGNGSVPFYGGLTSAGAFSWAKTQTPYGNITGIALDSSGNVYFGDGGLNTSGILKFSATGTLAWQKTIKTSAGGTYAGSSFINIDTNNIVYYVPNSANPPIIATMDASTGSIVRQRNLYSSTRNLTSIINIAPFPVISNSIFVAAMSPGNITSYGVIPNGAATVSGGEWSMPIPTNIVTDYGRTITARTPTITTITPTITTTALTRTINVPSNIALTPLS